MQEAGWTEGQRWLHRGGGGRAQAARREGLQAGDISNSGATGRGGTKTKNKYMQWIPLLLCIRKLDQLLFLRLFENDPVILSNHIFTYFASKAPFLTLAESFDLIPLVWL